jgi:hypothetical protein
VGDYGGVYDDRSLWEYLDSPDEVELVNMTVENVGNNPFGQVISASLTLRGLCHKLNGLWKSHDFYFQNGR